MIQARPYIPARGPNESLADWYLRLMWTPPWWPDLLHGYKPEPKRARLRKWLRRSAP